MPLRIEDYAIIGDTHTAAIVGRDGSIDWLCVPRFDSDACFASLLGDTANGYFRIAPAISPAPGTDAPLLASARRYRGETLVLETEFTTDTGSVRVTDCMPIREHAPEVVRVVEGLKGSVKMEMRLCIRFGYGSVLPWVRRQDGLLTATAGPDALALWTPVETHGEDMETTAEFTVHEGSRVPFVLTWYPSHESVPRPVDAHFAVEDTAAYWEAWSASSNVAGTKWGEPVQRSILTLKALTYHPTGGIIAAATTSLPEALGGERNWDYRYCWLRDATLTLSALMAAGYIDEARAWRDWLLRAVAGDPSKLQIMYGPAGERSLNESELDWLSGYEGSRPVRLGNAAAGQYQLDVYGEVLGALHEARRLGIDPSEPAWSLELAILDFLESGWKDPDDGIWEVRGPRRHFTHSKVMAWMAVDRGIQDIEQFGFDGPLDRLKALREAIHAEVCEKAFDDKRSTFTQYYGSKELDASVLMIPLVGFLPPDDPRVRGTVEAIERDLTHDGFALRYDSESSTGVDGLSGREGAFLACSFWLADNLALIGRTDDAEALFQRLLELRNDVGLLSEEYDPVAQRLVGNFPQAFSHVSLVNTAIGLAAARGSVPEELAGMAHDDRIRGTKVGPKRPRLHRSRKSHRLARQHRPNANGGM